MDLPVTDIWASCFSPLKIGELRAVFPLKWLVEWREAGQKTNDIQDRSHEFDMLLDFTNFLSTTQCGLEFKRNLVIRDDVLLMPPRCGDMLLAIYKVHPPMKSWRRGSEEDVIYPNVGLVYEIPNDPTGRFPLYDVLSFNSYKVEIHVNQSKDVEILHLTNELRLCDIRKLCLHKICGNDEPTPYHIQLIVRSGNEPHFTMELASDQTQTLQQLGVSVEIIQVWKTSIMSSPRHRPKAMSFPTGRFSSSNESIESPSNNYMKSFLEIGSKERYSVSQSYDHSHSVRIPQSPRKYTYISTWSVHEQDDWTYFLNCLVEVSPNRQTKFSQPMPIENIGNCCYLNVILQCLYRLDSFRDYFRLPDRFVQHVFCIESGSAHQRKPDVRQVIYSFYHFMMSYHPSGFFSPLNLLKYFRKIYTEFEIGRSHDALVFMCNLLDLLHNFLSSPTSGTSAKSSGSTQHIAGDEREKSIITNLFSGKQLNVIKCRLCSYESRSVQPIRFIGLSPNEVISDFKVHLVPLQLPPKIVTLSCVSLSVTMEEIIEMIKLNEPDYFKCEWVPYIFSSDFSSQSDVREGTTVRAVKKGNLLVLYERDKEVANRCKLVFVDFRRCRPLMNGNIELPPVRLVVPSESPQHIINFKEYDLVVNILSRLNSLNDFEVNWHDFTKTQRVHLIVNTNKELVQHLKNIYWTYSNPDSSPSQETTKYSFTSLLTSIISFNKKKEIQLDKLLEHSIRRTPLMEGSDYICHNCGISGMNAAEQIITQTLIHKTGPVLILHLRRFLPSQRGQDVRYEKDLTPVNIPEILDMSPYITEEEKSSPGPKHLVYKLMCVVEHHGSSIQDGHYTATIKGEDERTWWHVNDTVVRKINTYKCPDAILLFYQSVQIPP